MTTPELGQSETLPAVTDSLLDLRVQLQPSGLGSTKGFELLKILDNTGAVYRKLQYRTWKELEAAAGGIEDGDDTLLVSPREIAALRRRLSSISATGSSEGREEVAAANIIAEVSAAEPTQPVRLMSDAAVEALESEVWQAADESDRQLYLDNLREDTDAFLLFAGWAEAQRRKLIDPVLRNADTWDRITREKTLAVDQLNRLAELTTLAQTPPTIGAPMGRTAAATEALRNRTRQMLILSSARKADPNAELEEALFCMAKRHELLKKLSANLTTTINSISMGVQQQLVYLHVLRHLTGRWNVKREPYEAQVYQNDDTDYPYRAELWIELLTVPSRPWGLQQLDAPKNNLAAQLWEAADDAGFEPQLFRAEEEETEGAKSRVDQLAEWKERRTRRQFGHPYWCNPPVPISSPFGTLWCELFLTSKADEERLPAVARELIFEGAGGGGPPDTAPGNPRNSSENDTATAPPHAVNMGLRFGGDLGAYVRDGKRLRCDIQLAHMRWLNAALPNFVTNSGSPAGEINGNKAFVEPPDAGAKELETGIQLAGDDQPKTAAAKAAVEVHEALEAAQRICMENALFAIVLGQAARMQQHLAYPLVDEESFQAVKHELETGPSSAVLKVESIADVVLWLKPAVTSERNTHQPSPCQQPAHSRLPRSWVFWPVLSPPRPNGRPPRVEHLASRKFVTVLGFDSETVRFSMERIPIVARRLGPKTSHRVVAVIDIVVGLSFRGDKAEDIGATGIAASLHPSATPKGTGATAEALFSRKFARIAAPMGELAVCKLWQLITAEMRRLTEFEPVFLADLCRVNSPATHNVRGPKMFNEFHSWLQTQLSMAFFDVLR